MSASELDPGRASVIDRLQLEDGTWERTEQAERQAELAGPGRTRAPTCDGFIKGCLVLAG